MRTHFSALLVFVVALCSACGSDSLGEKFQAKPPQDKPDPEGPVIPGDSLWYRFLATYRPTRVGSSGGGLKETQITGNLCLDITDQTQSTVKTKATIKGLSAADDVYMQLEDVETTSASDGTSVDNILDMLWLKQFTGKARGHGMSSPKNVTFTTRSAPNTEAGLESLPFFDVRVGSAWQGWDGQGDPNGETNNFVNAFYAYFTQGSFDPMFVFSNDFRGKWQSGASCSGYSESAICNSDPLCSWDTTDEVCGSAFTMEVIWREVVDNAPDKFVDGAIQRKVRFRFSSRGVLVAASELVVPDSPGSVPSQLNECPADEDAPCASAEISLESPFSDAPCK